MSELSHIDDEGEARMVDVSAKPEQEREAVARGEIRLATATLNTIESGQAAKGNVLATARLAGIMAAKKTADLIPLCHPLAITHAEVGFKIPESRGPHLSQNRRRDGGAHRGFGRRADDLRHVQGDRQGDADHRHQGDLKNQALREIGLL